MKPEVIHQITGRTKVGPALLGGTCHYKDHRTQRLSCMSENRNYQRKLVAASSCQSYTAMKAGVVTHSSVLFCLSSPLMWAQALITNVCGNARTCCWGTVRPVEQTDCQQPNLHIRLQGHISIYSCGVTTTVEPAPRSVFTLTNPRNKQWTIQSPAANKSDT